MTQNDQIVSTTLKDNGNFRTALSLLIGDLNTESVDSMSSAVLNGDLNTAMLSRGEMQAFEKLIDRLTSLAG